jgi:uncharacterized protein (DUF1015 family)
MATIRAFRGLRPRAGLEAQVAAPPYDVLDSSEARVMAQGNPLTFLHINKPEIDLDPAINLYDDRVYATGVANLKRFIAEGTLVQDGEPCLYIYKQRMGDHEQFGLMACVSAAEYDADIIKKHELTRADKENDRTRHTHELNANAGPVFLTYPARAAVDALVAQETSRKPDVNFVAADGIGHTLWVIRDAAVQEALRQEFATIPALYVADGHHRSASAARVARMRREQNPAHRGDEEYNFFMAVIFPDNQLRIMDYNRVVKDLHGLDEPSFLARVAETFDVAPVTDPRPARVHDVSMFLGGKWYRLTARAGTFPADDPIASLDVSILQENLLAPVLGIADPRKDKRIDFVGGIRGLGELERRCQEGWAVAFALHPTTVDQLLGVADAGRIMPPKSTWFEPKLRSGLVVHLLD